MGLVCSYYKKTWRGARCTYHRTAGRATCGGNVDRCEIPGGPPTHVCGCVPGRSRCPTARKLFQRGVDAFDQILDNRFANNSDWKEYHEAMEEYNRHYPRGRD